MTWVAALSAGVGLGLLCFGGLRLTLRRLPHSCHRRVLLGFSSLARLSVVGLGLYGLSREGAGALLVGLLGLWLTRCGFLWKGTGVCRER